MSMRNSELHISRRRFLATSGATLAASSLVHESRGSISSPAPRRGGIDCQSHLFVPDIVSIMEQRKTDPTVFKRGADRYVKMGAWVRKILPKHMDIEAKVADMDANDIQITALSINDPGPEWFGSDGPEVARMANNFIAGVAKQYPSRFIGLCVLPWQNMKAAMKELERCVQELGMGGILVYTNLAGRYPDEPEFRPVFARATKLGIPILLHPAKPVTTEQVKGYEMTSSLGNMFDDTIGLTRIIMSGILDQYPDLKLVAPHLGGTLPFIIGRLDHQVKVLKRGPKYLTRAPSEYLRQVYLDIVSPLPLAMRFAYDMMGADRLLFSSDHPWVDPKLIRDSLQSLNLPRDEEDKIFGGNARQLFGIS